MTLSRIGNLRRLPVWAEWKLGAEPAKSAATTDQLGRVDSKATLVVNPLDIGAASIETPKGLVLAHFLAGVPT